MMAPKSDDVTPEKNDSNRYRFSTPSEVLLPVDVEHNGNHVHNEIEYLISVASGTDESQFGATASSTHLAGARTVSPTLDDNFATSPKTPNLSPEPPSSLGPIRRLASNTARAIVSIRRIFGKLIPDAQDLEASQKRIDGTERDQDNGRVEGSRSVFGAPIFRLHPFFMANTVCTDPVVLYNNAIRFETRRLFAILYCLQEREEDELHPGDIQSFFLWFEDYHNLFCTYVSVMNDVLLPSLRDLIPFRHLTPHYFANEGERLNRIVSKTLTSSNRFMHMYEPAQAAAKLIEIYTEFAQPLLWFLFSLEKYCGVVLDRFGSAQEAKRISRIMASSLRRMPFFRKVLPLLLRWLYDRPQTKFIWLSFHYDYVTVRLYRIWNRQSEHDRIVDYFKLMSNTQLAV